MALPKTRFDEFGRVCTKCLTYKTWENFYPHQNGLNGKNPRCITCLSQRTQEKRTKQEYCPLRQKNQYLRSRYGITLKQYKEMFDSQGGRCAICEKRVSFIREGDSPKYHTAHVDHNHTTNKARGLLCSTCNRALGLFQDNPRLLKKAAKYAQD